MRPNPFLLSTLIGTLVLGSSLWAQDSLFDSLDSVEADSTPQLAPDQQQLFMGDLAPKIGGRIGTSLTAEWDASEGHWPTEGSLDANVKADLYLDARPTQDFRFFAKGRLEEPSGEWQVKELFSDFNISRIVFLRTGKQTLKSGVGYYFSPADFLSLASIDPEDPLADREGPLAIKATVGWGESNVTMVVLPPKGDGPENTGTFWQWDGVWEDWEWGGGLLYRMGEAPQGMVTATGSLGPFRAYGEGVASWGTDRKQLEIASGKVSSVEVTTGLYLSWTLGVRWSDDEANATLNAQFYVNAGGYSDSSLLNVARQMVKQGVLSETDLQDWGRYQAAVGGSLRDLGGSDFDLSILWTADAGDRSGRLSPAVSYHWQDHVSVSLSVPWNYGTAGSVFAPQGSFWGLKFDITLGTGSF